MVSFTTEFAPCKPLRVRHPLSSTAQGQTCRGRGKLYVTLTSGSETPSKFKCQGLDMQGRKFYVTLTSGSEAPSKFKCQGLDMQGRKLCATLTSGSEAPSKFKCQGFDMQGRKLYAVLNSLHQAPSKFCSANIQFCSYFFSFDLCNKICQKGRDYSKSVTDINQT